MFRADQLPWLGAGRRLPWSLWNIVRAEAGCQDIAERECEAEWAARLSRELSSVPAELVAGAGVAHLFVASALQHDGVPHDGIAYERDDGTRWIGLNLSLLEDDSEDPSLQIPRLRAILVEELVHVWDFTLEARGSPYFSVDRAGVPGPLWGAVECGPDGEPLPFAIPDGKATRIWADRIAEDWASAVLWYLFRPERLKTWAPERHDFVARLFRDEIQRS